MKSEEAAPYLSLARRYRPQIFDEVAGQESISATLKNAVAAGRIAQAYLFIGPRGVGKTTTARILAKALNCVKGPTAQPCGRCDSCREISAGASLDVLEMDAASHTGVDNIREVIIDTVSLVPNRDRRKIFIIDEAHMLSTAAFNALLKTLEEPPPHVLFILATTEAVKIPPTIASRCQRFRFKPLPAQSIVAHLKKIARDEKVEIEPAALEFLAKAADGSLRDALSLLDQCVALSAGKTVREATVRDMFGLVPEEVILGVAQALVARDARALSTWLGKIYEDGLDHKEMLRDLRAALQDIYLGKMGGPASLAPAWQKIAAALSAEDAAFWLRRIASIFESMRQDEQPRMSLEIGLYGGLQACGDLSQWVKRLEALEERLSGKTPRETQPAPGAQGVVLQARTPRADISAAEPSPSGAWPKVIAALHEQKASLAAILEHAAVSRDAQGVWRISFQKSFELELAEKNRDLIAEKLSEACGAPARIAMDVRSLPPRGDSEEIVDKAAPAAAAPPSGGQWHDVMENAPACPPELEKAKEILGGRVKVKKKS